jgi:hypothetical protein
MPETAEEDFTFLKPSWYKTSSRHRFETSGSDGDFFMTVKRARKTTKALPGVRPGTRKIRGISKKMFVDAYIANKCNGRAAMKAMGAPHSTASARGSAMLRDPEVQKLIEERQAEIAQDFKLSADEVLASLARAMRFDPRLLFDETGKLKKISDLPDEVALELEDFEISPKRGVKIGFPKKHAARDQAMRFFGLFVKDKAGYNPNDDDEPPPPISVSIDFKDARRRKS